MTVKKNLVFNKQFEGDVKKKGNKENKDNNKFQRYKKKKRKNNKKKKDQSKIDLEEKKKQRERERLTEREKKSSCNPFFHKLSANERIFARKEKSLLLLYQKKEEKEIERKRITARFEFGQLKNPYNSSSDSSDSDESYFSTDPVNFVTGRLPNKEEEQKGIIGMIVYENSDPVYVFNKSN